MAIGSAPATAALAFGEEAYQTSGPRLMGAMAASEGFLRAYVKYSGAQKLVCYAPSEVQFKSFVARMKGVGGDLPCELVPPLDIARLAQPGTLYFPDPSITEATWHRRRVGDATFSITGVTHTTCSDAFMDMVGAWSMAPVQSWDALICTSQSVHGTLTQVMDRYEEYLRERLGATTFTRPQLPVIPLGVDIDRISSGAQAESFRRLQRAALGIGADDVALLFFGRLSYHAKAHPLPMYLALEQAAQRTGKRLHLILAGWFANEALERTFLQGAARHCPSVSVRHVDGRRPEVRQQIWFAADIFTSLSDNIQETFGLTPIEAMAAGLPLVISDWDGYRDTVQHGVQGFLVPTTIPPPGAGEEIAVRWAARADTYDRYIAHQSQCTAVDVAACADYYVRLIESPSLRKQLGDAGRERARSVFSWQTVIHAYQELWTELAARRSHAVASSKPGRPWHPLRRDPLELFASYATRTLTDEVIVRLTTAGTTTQLTAFIHDSLANYAGMPFVLATLDESHALLGALAHGQCTVGDLTSAFAPPRRAAIVRTIGWLLKCGMVEVDTTTS